MMRAALFPIVLMFSALVVSAQESDRVEALYQALGLPDILSIMQREGLNYGEDLAGNLFESDPGPSWQTRVMDVYRLERLETLFRDAFAEVLGGEDVAAMLEFFESELGQRIVGLELSAREALLAPSVEEMAEQAWNELESSEAPRAEILQRFAATNDLIEYNVVGAMNSNFAFYKGLEEGGAFQRRFEEAEMLADVWSQEGKIRAETEDWLFGYLALAYQPLTDDEIEAYVAFSETTAGQALNRAIFEAFDVMYVSVSRALGEAAAGLIGGQEL